MDLKPTGDLHELFRRLVDIESVSMHEAPIADAVEETLAPHRHLEVTRLGNSVVARTHLGRSERVVIAGHLDTVPVVENLPSYICLLYTSPSPRDRTRSRMPSSA